MIEYIFIASSFLLSIIGMITIIYLLSVKFWQQSIHTSSIYPKNYYNITKTLGFLLCLFTIITIICGIYILGTFKC